MKRLTRTTVFVFGIVCTGAITSAQIHPVLDRGYSPDNAYQVGDIDAVNTFNGGLSLRLPIGQTYPVGGRLSYQLVLHYNSSFWDHSWKRDRDDCDPDKPPGRPSPSPCGILRVGWCESTTKSPSPAPRTGRRTTSGGTRA